MRGRYLIFLIILALICGSACTLSGRPIEATIAPLPTQAQAAFIDGRDNVDAPIATEETAGQTQAQQVSAQSAGSQSGGSQNAQQPAQTGGGSNAPVTYWIPPGCSPRYDWYYTYRVRAGDTLSRIASWAWTNVQTLAVGNCISNPNLIYVGQVLRVPRQIGYPPPPHLPRHRRRMCSISGRCCPARLSTSTMDSTRFRAAR